MIIPISKLQFGPAEEKELLQVLRSGNIAQGPKVKELEDAFAEEYGIKHVVAVNNGTTALIAALTAHEIGPGDEVITSPFTFAATLNAILYVGATPVFADISETDFNMDVTNIPELITSKTKAIMPVHLYGQASNMFEISRIARDHNLVIIQDAAQAQGAKYNQNFVGSEHTSTFSLYATKNMTTGEGGFVTTDNNEIAERLRILRNQGMKSRYEYVMTGNNWRLTDLQASIAIPQLRNYQDTVNKRTKNAEFYSHQFNELQGIFTPITNPGNTHAWHQYTLRITGECKSTREEIINHLTSEGIGTGIYYPRAVYDYDAFRKHPLVGKPKCVVAERVAAEVLSIPIHQHLSNAELAKVASTFAQIVES